MPDKEFQDYEYEIQIQINAQSLIAKRSKASVKQLLNLHYNTLFQTRPGYSLSSASYDHQGFKNTNVQKSQTNSSDLAIKFGVLIEGVVELLRTLL